MGRMYKISTGFIAVSVAQDLLEIQLGSGELGIFHGLHLTQTSDTDPATESEILQIDIKRATGSYTSGSGGGSPTVVRTDPGDAVDTFVVEERNNTTQAVAGSGALETIESIGWQVLAPGSFIHIPETRDIFPPSAALIISCPAPSDELTMNCVAYFEELG